MNPGLFSSLMSMLGPPWAPTPTGCHLSATINAYSSSSAGVSSVDVASSSLSCIAAFSRSREYFWELLPSGPSPAPAAASLLAPEPDLLDTKKGAILLSAGPLEKAIGS